MLVMLKLCNFGTIYLWIFVWKVLQVCTGYRIEGTGTAAAGAAQFLMKPYPYQMFDYTNDLLQERSNWWQLPPSKYKQHPDNERLDFAFQSKAGSGFEEDGIDETSGRVEAAPGHSIPASEKSLANLNDYDFDMYKMTNRISQGRPMPILAKIIGNGNRRHQFPLGLMDVASTNIRFPINVINAKKRQNSKQQKTLTSLLEALRKRENYDVNDSDNENDDDDENDNDKVNVNGNDDVVQAIKSTLPFKEDETGVATSNTDLTNSLNGNEHFNYSDNTEIVRNNYFSEANKDQELRENLVNGHDKEKKSARKYRYKKIKQEHNTPYLPSISGGAMTNLGKFFRDLSRNVQFSEKHQWGPEEQKLLEGDPTLGNLHHHLAESHVGSDHTGEWIKAIRYYRPSQKIRSLVAMNPHGQWAHGSQFIDPNYMWMGLGK